MESKRERAMSQKGKEYYEGLVGEYWKKLSSVKKAIEYILSEEFGAGNPLVEIKEELEKYFSKYTKLSQEFTEFLQRCGTEESSYELSSHKLIYDSVHSKVNNVLQNISGVEPDSSHDIGAEGGTGTLVDVDQEKLFHVSLPSHKPEAISDKPARSIKNSLHAISSTASSFLMKPKAKAEAAKARLVFAEKEAMLRKEQARREEVLRREQAECAVNLDILAHQKALAEAEAEVLAVEEVLQESNLDVPVQELDKHERTLQYVQEQSQFSRAHVLDERQDPAQNYRDGIHRDHLSAQAPEFVPNQQTQPVQELASEFTRFLLKKDLLLLKLVSFNDEPNSYHSWKLSFIGVVTELRANAFEELDLLVKWLGPESKKYALSMRAACCSQPSKGLHRLWKRLDERYGSPETVEAFVKMKLMKFGKIGRDYKRLLELSDILCEIEALKEDPKYSSVLAYFDSSTGVNPIIQKLPFNLQHKWTEKASRYKKDYSVSFPPFPFLVQFIETVSSTLNDPSFNFEGQGFNRDVVQHAVGFDRKHSRPSVTTRKTEIEGQSQFGSGQTFSNLQSKTVPYCPFHKSYHSLNRCRAFKQLSFQERRDIVLQSGYCFRCCESNRHIARYCKCDIKCSDCDSTTHCTAMHINQDFPRRGKEVSWKSSAHGGEPVVKGTDISSKCSKVCGETFSGKSCGKTILTRVFPKDSPEKGMYVYAIIDDQSNRTLAMPKLLDMLSDDMVETLSYSLSSCNGVVETCGRLGNGLIIESLDGSVQFELPGVVECDQIPNAREEIPSPKVVQHHSHLNHLVDCIPPLMENAEVLLLIGRDLPDAHHVLEQCFGKVGSPFAQKLPLGWVVVGNVCLGEVHAAQVINVNKTSILPSGRPTVLEPCRNSLEVQEISSVDELFHDLTSDSIGKSVFERTKHDDKPGLSTEDRCFLELMEKEFVKDEKGNWTAPLPFKPKRPKLPNNRKQALRRAKLLDSALKKNQQKKDDFFDFMKTILEMGHAEVAPPILDSEECWYLPLFGIYHPKKPTQLRGVFDSSAVLEDVSLNKVLMTGPDLANNLVSVLLLFRKSPVAVTADIQKMFYCFYVKREHRKYLRFFWYQDNNFENDLIEYQMCVHVFGNSPSPAVATYGLRKSVESCEDEYGSDVKETVNNNFYVDDLLISVESETEAVSLIKRTQEALMTGGNVRLHKIASNTKEVIVAFPQDDLAKDLKSLDIPSDSLPLHRSLGLSWNLECDAFEFAIQDDQVNKPYTRRGLLSVINSLLDPLGFLAPIVIKGKILLRELATKGRDWDEELSAERRHEWDSWIHSLKNTKDLAIPRTYVNCLMNNAISCQLHVYSDASEKAIAAVAFLKIIDKSGLPHTGFILGKAKVAPTHGTTIPRLELCAAVLSVDIAEFICEHLDFRFDTVKYYTDSKVVLGYIRNETRRFYTYVSNRVNKIKQRSGSEQWKYVPTNQNPADEATRSSTNRDLNHSMWLTGPPQMSRPNEMNTDDFPLVEPHSDKDIRPDVTVTKSTLSVAGGLRVQKFEKFSSWISLVNAFSSLKRLARRRSKQLGDSTDVKLRLDSEDFIIRQVQREIFSDEISSLESRESISRQSSISSLNPFLDNKGLLRVGGRLSKSSLSSHEKHPLIIPGKSHIAKLLVRHHHEAIKHQGRHLTEGAVRSSGLWITGGKRLISSILHKCVLCRRLRRPLECQKMADLPVERLEPGPPFTSVGVDTFGPWSVVARRTRGGYASSKRWAILFTCLTTRAVHIEIVEELSSSSFINALRRFTSVRGKVKLYRSDRGTNFVGCTDHLGIDAINVEDRLMKHYLHKANCTWIFNSPHSSHMGGVWERMIGLVRRILDSILLSSSKQVTHEVLTTFMAEVSAIINARPLVPVSSDPECPEVLSPSMLLTQKSDIFDSPPGDLALPDMYKQQWQRVQLLADTFWKRWRAEYIQLLQSRRKWTDSQQNLKAGDVVLLREKSVYRNNWPLGRIISVVASDDDLVRKAEVRVLKNDRFVSYIRPVNELVLLLEN